MTFRLGGFLLVLCSLACASAFLLPNFSLFKDSSNLIHVKCVFFSGIVRTFPLSNPQKEKVYFEHRTPCKRSQYAVSHVSNLRNSPEFDAKLKTVVLVTGWNSEMDDDYTERLTKAYLCRGGYNFIVVNTSGYVKTEYINSAYNTEKLGKFIAVGLKNLNIPGENIHLIGHSLGAHMVGGAGRHFEAQTGNKIGRITGLDPARPCFIQAPVFRRLSATDATFVDIIHSNPGESGTEEAIGHVDFYPGGLKPTKPGCLPLDMSCSHSLSIDYYIESVYAGNENNFMGAKCNNYSQLRNRKCTGTKAPMGYAATATAKGIYILGVNSKAPYGKNAKDSAYLELKDCGVCTE